MQIRFPLSLLAPLTVLMSPGLLFSQRPTGDSTGVHIVLADSSALRHSLLFDDSSIVSFNGLLVLRVPSVTYSAVLPYVFFDSNSTAIPGKYHRFNSYSETLAFDDRNFDGDLPAAHYDILNLMGKRLRDNPGIRVRIQGCNSGTYGETEGFALSAAREQAVRAYLQEMWAIPDMQLVGGSARNLPRQPSNSRHPEGRAENERVEFRGTDRSSCWELFGPVVDTVTSTLCSPPVMAIERRNRDSTHQLLHRTIIVRGPAGNLRAEYEWDTACDRDRLFLNRDMLSSCIREGDSVILVQLIEKDGDGARMESNSLSIPVLFRNLVEMSASAQLELPTSIRLLHGPWMPMEDGIDADNCVLPEMFATRIRRWLTENDLFEVTYGTSDVGLPTRNMRKSERYSEVMCRWAGRKHSARAFGTGSCAPPFSNATPEGRMLNNSTSALLISSDVLRVVMETP